MVLEAMEFSRIQNMVMKSETQQSTMFLNDGRNLVMANGMEYDFVPFQSSERLLILDDHGVLREAFTDVSYLISQNLPAYADDTETPSYLLDHMYAKKPREPGSELTPSKPRRRAKRKVQIVEQYVIPDSQPPAPKINIIRQRMPSSAVYKSLSQILDPGGPQKTSTNSTSNSPNNLVKGKTGPSKQSAHIGRAKIKEGHSKTMYASFDEVNKLFTPKSLLGNTNKSGKDLSSKSNKYNMSKTTPNSSAIIMDDLQQDGASYEEEMLFDFGIAEDDEAITCPLGTDGFSDEFDEFGVSMEAYNNSNQSSLKSSGLSKSPITTSGILLNHRSQLKPSIHPQLPPEISDDDDSNQIMVSIHNRRPSQDWDSVQLFEQSMKQEPDSDCSQSPRSNLRVSAQSISVLSSCDDTEDKKPSLSSLQSTPDGPYPQDDLSKKIKKEVTEINFSSENNNATSIIQDSKSIIPTRRSSRVVKTPAWLEDSDKIPIAKRQRKKSSA